IQLDDDDDGNIEDNEQLANAIQESLKLELPPRNNYGNVFPPLPWERDLKSVHMEYRHFRNDHYASQFQQSGSVETEGQSSSMAHKQSVTTHHLNNDPDAEQQGFLRATEGQILKYKESEDLFSEKIALLKRSVGHKEYLMGLLRTELEKVKEEKEGFEFKIAKFEKSAKDLDQLLASQVKKNSNNLRL
ncbi:hypothetical protein Tco_1527743, partial [Tanacetum coccineum]